MLSQRRCEEIFPTSRTSEFLERNTRTWIKKDLPFINNNELYNGGLIDGCGVKISSVSLLLIGGRGNDNNDARWKNYKTVTKYVVDLADGENGKEWTIMPELKRARYGHSCVFLNDKGPFFLSIKLTHSDCENNYNSQFDHSTKKIQKGPIIWL